MEEKLSKQSINRLNIEESKIKTLKENKIESIGQLCKKSKNDLKKFNLKQDEINKIEIQLQLLGLNLRNSL